MKLKTKYQLILFSAIISVPLVLLVISIAMSIIYDIAFKTKNQGIPFHQSFAYPTMLIVFFLSLVLLAILFSKSINALLSKINMLNKTIRHLASDEKIPDILDVPSEDEIGELIKSVNLLIERTTYRELQLKQQHELQKEVFNKLRHDINTPLTAIRLQLFYLEEYYQEQPLIVESLNKQIQYIADLTNDFNVQTMETIENSYIVNDDVHVSELLTTMLKKWSYLYSIHDIELVFQSFDKDLLWNSNDLWLQRMFDNIFQNTLKHSKATKFEVSIENGIVCLKDNGIGFDGNRTTTGLGLNIIEDIANILQINYTLQSNEEGTTFCFRFI
ncbi:sensor histidine kinase [Lysinibacillus parviboronicapiens]|uniref:sensor histidine kinase n=1 Tax=Lysinibacillus parviboronicapiens TaxID=436516 RepID=UPI000D3DB5E6|nr:HAMP domain-containing sensor histidine kinase [Lysinibacillus parviboronicapiens]